MAGGAGEYQSVRRHGRSVKSSLKEKIGSFSLDWTEFILGNRVLWNVSDLLEESYGRLKTALEDGLGTECLKDLQERGVDLVQYAFQMLNRFHREIAEQFGLDFHQVSGKPESSHYFSAGRDRAEIVESGALQLHFSEHSLWNLLLCSRGLYAKIIEYLEQNIVAYLEKSFYVIEKQWFLCKKAIQRRGESENSVSEEHAGDLRYRNLLSRSFWREYFLQALQQLRLDLSGSPYFEEALNDGEKYQELSSVAQDLTENATWDSHELSASYFWSISAGIWQHKLLFREVCRIPLMAELQGAFRIGEYRKNFLKMSREALEEALEKSGVALDFRSGEGPVSHYREFPEGSGLLPDELLHVEVGYYQPGLLEECSRQFELELARVSEEVQAFFAEVEKRMRFFRVLRGVSGLKRFWQKRWKSLIRMEENLAFREVLIAKRKSLDPNQFGLPQRNRLYEIKLLLELLEKADKAIEYQMQFFPSAKCIDLQQILNRLRSDLLQLCDRAALERSSPGLRIVGYYRTVKSRKESLVRLKALFQMLEDRLQESGNKGVLGMIQKSIRL